MAQWRDWLAARKLLLITSRPHLAAWEDAMTISLEPCPPTEAAALLARLAGRPRNGCGWRTRGVVRALWPAPGSRPAARFPAVRVLRARTSPEAPGNGTR